MTAIQEFEGGVMLCLDVSFRVLNTRTVLDGKVKVWRMLFDEKKNFFTVLKEAMMSSRGGNYKEQFEKAVLGNIVVTRYNNKTYRIDEILWNMNPLSTFKLSNGQEISYQEYYKAHHNLNINDLKQPLLMNTQQRWVNGTKQSMTLCLLPEFSFLTGLSDAQRADFKVMKDVATYTRISRKLMGFKK